MLTTLYLLNDKEMINSDDPYSVVARVFSKIVLIVYLLAPAALTYYLGKKLDRGEFKTPELQQAFSIAIEGWNYRQS